MSFLYQNDTISSPFIQDVNGKWTIKKKRSIELSKVYEALHMDNKALRVKTCGNFLEFAKNKETSEIKLYNANFCKIRLCPMCSWRRSLKVFGQLSKIMDFMKSEKWQFIFLTLTIKNCDPVDLKQSITDLLNGYKQLKRKKAFKNAIFGDYRALEVTYNSDTGFYHPHLHVILCVLPSYFTDRLVYISQEKWGNMWAKSMKLDYNPIVDVRKVKCKKSAYGSTSKDLGAIVAETAKYTVKSSDYLTGNLENDKKIVFCLDNALLNRRLIGMGGAFKEAHKQLNLDNPNTGDLVEELVLNSEVWDLIKLSWHGSGYTKL